MIGAALKRREDPPLVRGAGRYVDALALPHMAFLTIPRSPHASARIAGVDTTRAAKLPGVLAIFTARDVEGHVDAEPAIGFPPMARRPPRPLLARDFVRYVGEPVAAVVSVDRYVGADAATAIEVEYEPRPAVSDPEAALAPGAPRVHAEFPDNVVLRWSWSEGDVEGAFARAARVVRLRLVNQRVAGVALEPRGCVAEYRGCRRPRRHRARAQVPHALAPRRLSRDARAVRGHADRSAAHRALSHPGRPLRADHRLHQHHVDGAVPGRRTAGGRVHLRADDGRGRPSVRPGSRRRAPSQPDPRRRAPVQDAVGLRLRLGAVRGRARPRADAGRLQELPRAPARPARGAPLARDRILELRRDCRRRAVEDHAHHRLGERRRARGAVGQGHGDHGDEPARPGPGDGLRPDHGESPRRADGRRHRPPQRHGDRRRRRRHVRQPLDVCRRPCHRGVHRESAGEGQAHRRRAARSGTGGHRRRSGPLRCPRRARTHGVAGGRRGRGVGEHGTSARHGARARRDDRVGADELHVSLGHSRGRGRGRAGLRLRAARAPRRRGRLRAREPSGAGRGTDSRRPGPGHRPGPLGAPRVRRLGPVRARIVDGLRNREGRAAADVRAGQHRDTLAGQRAGRQGLRREWHDRLDASDRERGDRRARAVRDHSPRHAAGAREHLGSGRTREEDTMILLATAFSVVLLLAGLAAPALAQTVNVYTAWPESLSQPIFKAYTAKTGVQVNFIRLSTGELVARATGEKNNPRADVIWGAPGDGFAAAKEAGLLEPYRPPTWDRIPPELKDRDAYYTAVAKNTLIFMSNAKLLKEKNLKPPTSWMDLLDPAYKGQIQTADARTSGTALTRILSIDRK